MRVSPAIDTPVTPVTPVCPSTPMILNQMFGERNVMDDLHLAAELGKTLLERNRDLEATIRELRSVVEDKNQEIEYLSKQTAALREVNNSRLRIYEQLEISIQELEKNNQRMCAEAVVDKRKVKSLSENLELLEVKYEDLQRAHEEATARRPRNRKSSSPESPRKTTSADEASSEDGTIVAALNDQIKSLLEELHKTRAREAAEARRREHLEVELSCLAQENAGLKEQIEILRDNERTCDDQLISPDTTTTTSSVFCRKCMGLADETGSNVTMQDVMDDLEDMDESFDDVPGDCALFRLKNGALAWGSQESLASKGQVVESKASSSPHHGGDNTPQDSLLNELDTQYRILIEKYEALVEANKQSEMKNRPRDESGDGSLVHLGVDEHSGPMGFVITESQDSTKEPPTFKCQRCATCTCDIKTQSSAKVSADFARGSPIGHSNAEELLEVETASSGFSEEEKRFCAKTTQTDQPYLSSYSNEIEDICTPTPLHSTLKLLDFKSPLNPCESRFQNVPEVQKLFSEIFENLKKTEPSTNEGGENENQAVDRLISTASQCKNPANKKKNSNKENLNPSRINCPNSDGRNEVNSQTKPNRPNFLDLETSSTCSSSSRSRRRRKHSRARKRMDRSAPAKEILAKESFSVDKRETSLTAVQQRPNNANDKKSEPKQINLLKPTQNFADAVALSTSLPEIRTKCHHKKKNKKQNKTVKGSTQLENKHLNNALGRSSPIKSPVKTQTNNLPSQIYDSPYSRNPPSSTQVLPSVQVAKLIRVEKSYAEVLKSKPKRY